MPHARPRTAALPLERATRVAATTTRDDADHATELDDVLRRVASRRRGRRGRPRGPVLRDARVRHRRAARRPRRRSQPDEPRGGHPCGSRPHGVPAGTQRPSRVVVIGLRRAAQLRRLRPRHRGRGRRRRRHARCVLPRPLPTPVLAFAIRHLGADAGVMVTASHNPPQDNGYKVYLGDGSQIVPPADAEIAAAHRARRAGRRRRRAPTTAGRRSATRCSSLPRGRGRGRRPARARATSPWSTPRCTGSATRRSRRAFVRAGFAAPTVVASQAEPDPDFPTVAFPNPEEPGAIDAALALAAQVGRRHRHRQRPGRRPVCRRGARPGVREPPRRLADAARRRGGRAARGAHPVPAASTRTRSSPTRSCRRGCSRRMAGAAGVRHEETLTGFKWISRVPTGCATATRRRSATASTRRSCATRTASARPCCSPRWRRGSRREGRTLLDVLDDLAVEHGVHATDAFSVRVADLALIGDGDGAAARRPRPRRSAGWRSARVDDLAQGSAELPPTDGLRYHLADGSRVIVRPERHRAQAQGLPRGHRARRGARHAGGRRARTRPAGWPAIRAVDGGAHRPLTHVGPACGGRGSARWTRARTARSGRASASTRQRRPTGS